MSSNRWPIVTRDHPCRECGKADRCTTAPDGSAGHCFRHDKTWRDGENGRNPGYVGAAHRPKPQASQTPERNWQAVAERLRGAMTADHLAALADTTGVPAASWSLLSPGWVGADDLRNIHAGGAGWKENPPDDAWAFAEHDGDGQIVGLSLRAKDGRKGAPAGSKRGLIVPRNIHQSPDPVLIVEGASDVAACCALGQAAVGRPSNRAGAADTAKLLEGRTLLVVGERDGKPSGAWPGRDGAKAVAQQIAGRWGEGVRWTLPPLEAKDVRDWLKAKLAAGLDANNADAMKAAGTELLAALEAGAKEAKAEKRTQADALVELALETYRLGMSTDGQVFAVARDGPALAIMFRGSGSGLRAALSKSYRKTTGKTPSASALADALLALEGMAQDAPREPVALRVAEHEGAIVLDLGDDRGRAVVVKAGGWSVEAVSPVLFHRTALTGAIPEPVVTATDGTKNAMVLNELRDLLNVDDDSWPLVVSYFVAALIPEIPHPVLMLGGEQGTGKSTAARLLVGLIDASPAPLRSEPRQPRQWVISAAGSWVVTLDNVSHIPPWLSDAICKAVTGDGWIDRKLYTDAELAVLAFRRCVIITSIDPGAMRGDLADRLLLVDLVRIHDGRRRTEAELLAAFEAIRPRLLGALLSALNMTMAALRDVNLKTMPRMADFARVLAALDAACPELTGGKSLNLFNAQRHRIAGEVVESDTVAAAVVKLMDSRDLWTGTAGELLMALTPTAAPKRWPATARALAGQLGRVRPALRGVGILHDPPAPNDKKRTHRIEKIGNRPPEPPDRPNNDITSAPEQFDSRLLPGGRTDPKALPPADRPENGAVCDTPTPVSGGMGGVGGTVPPISAPARTKVRI